ncbi:C40 family peptidase [Pseudonocardia nigra]|uniref:C40 family peptidase n=1 Tax=Pseudonocardia nigra TaxID=1921578 RepID=UPI001C5F8E23|nr:C40 family peptidase [Pseudonocardia nigra]
MVRAAAVGLAALLGALLVIGAIGTAVLGGSGAGLGIGTGFAPSPAAIADIPTHFLALYVQAAATCPGLDWALLAAVGKIETDHGRSRLPGVTSGENSARAGGPMQFLQPTFNAVIATHPPPPGGARPPSRYHPHDAVHAAAAYLCDSGARNGDLDRALFTYNHSHAYVDDVLTQAAAYRAAPHTGSGPGLLALDYARAQLGLPYLWGGDGPTAGDPGFDCSGLTTAAWAAAGITLPRTAHTQYRAGPLLPPGTPLKPGDLLFFGTPERVHHVGIATGDATLMIHAPRRGTTIRIQDAHGLPDFLAASRPAP